MVHARQPLTSPTFLSSNLLLRILKMHTFCDCYSVSPHSKTFVINFYSFRKLILFQFSNRWILIDEISNWNNLVTFKCVRLSGPPMVRLHASKTDILQMNLEFFYFISRLVRNCWPVPFICMNLDEERTCRCLVPIIGASGWILKIWFWKCRHPIEYVSNLYITQAFLANKE